NLLDSPCLAAIATMAQQFQSRKWFWFAILDSSCPAQEVLWLIKKYVCANNREKTGDIPGFPYRYNGDIHFFMCIEILNVVE
ncbi:hypothetical protein NE599_20670, partial [[Clostridium] symbiosum]|uniref:hypothetical protein n=1 Tax=Clostridium symbiosum TaxID=1512 RepID=UPI00210DD929